MIMSWFVRSSAAMAVLDPKRIWFGIGALTSNIGDRNRAGRLISIAP